MKLKKMSRLSTTKCKERKIELRPELYANDKGSMHDNDLKRASVVIEVALLPHDADFQLL